MMIEALESARIVAQIDDRFKKIEKRLEEMSTELYSEVNDHHRDISDLKRAMTAVVKYLNYAATPRQTAMLSQEDDINAFK